MLKDNAVLLIRPFVMLALFVILSASEESRTSSPINYHISALTIPHTPHKSP
jgi:hypothetical protein